MRITEIINEDKEPLSFTTGYHMTLETNMDEIMEYGLEPRNDRLRDYYIGEGRVFLIPDTGDQRLLHGEISRVHSDIEDELQSEGDIDTPITLLKLDITGYPIYYAGHGLSYYTTKTITPDRITDLGWKALQKY